jgi:hypothetical protein
MTDQHFRSARAIAVPDAHALIKGARGYALSVGAEGDTIDIRRVAHEHERGTGTIDVPDASTFVKGAGDDAPSVRAEGDGTDGV